jgi:hypothetical protein
MLYYASPGVRNAARKGSNALIHHGGHNGPGGSTTTTPTSKYTVNHLRSALHVTHPPLPPTFQTVRPRNPPHKLFTATRNVFQWFFTQLSTPGIRVPTNLAQLQHSGTRSLHAVAYRESIQNRLSASARHALKNNPLIRQANPFSRSSSGSLPPRCGGVAQVGLGLARNFSTTRPIFQQLADNVPVVGRAFYEIDWDVQMRNEHARMQKMSRKSPKEVPRTQEMNRRVQKKPISTTSSHTESQTADNVDCPEDIDHYFPSVNVAAVTTNLLIPLAPTPTSRHPLPLTPSPTSTRGEPTLLPPLSFLGDLNASHSTHALRVSTLFTHLDQANVWARGVKCSAYSHRHDHRRDNGPDILDIGEGDACTILKVEFVGWTRAEVRGVLGESGTGWCVLEEVTQEDEDDTLSDSDSSLPELLGSEPTFQSALDTGLGYSLAIDPAESFVMPTLDFSSSFLESSTLSLSQTTSAYNHFVTEMENEPWADESSLSGSSSFPHPSDLVVDPPTLNGWFGSVYGSTYGVKLSSRSGWNVGTERLGLQEYAPSRY